MKSGYHEYGINHTTIVSCASISENLDKQVEPYITVLAASFSYNGKYYL